MHRSSNNLNHEDEDIVRSMEIIETLVFDSHESCEAGLRHPIYSILSEVKKLRPGYGLRVLVNDDDWFKAIESIIRTMKKLDYEYKGMVNGYFHELIIFKKEYENQVS